MKQTLEHWQLLICIAFTWTGFVSAISFMEAWLKFQAQGVTLSIGLNIGRLIFNTLNKVEWVFAIASLVLIYSGGGFMFKRSLIILLPILLLVLQTFWLLPALDSRASLHITGTDVPTSNLHFYYVGAELVKVVSLVIFGIKIFK